MEKNWKRIFEIEPEIMKTPEPTELTPAETPEFKFTAKDIEELKASGKNDEQIKAEEKRINDTLTAEAFNKKLEASQK